MQIISRKDAIAKGLDRYFSGKPCPYGHVAERYVSVSGCVECGVMRANAVKEKRQSVRAAEPLTPRQEAKLAGQTQYTPDFPCTRCGTQRRLVSNGTCMQCAANAMRKRYHENEEMRDNQAAYRARNSEAINAHTRNRRARLAGLGGSHTVDDILDLFDEQEGRCPYCNVYLRDWHVDHKTPLARGGDNGKTNLQLTCPTCNVRKHTKTDAEFRAMLASAFSVSEGKL
jgi:5-methylcytosine-specific restriction endonuclease McrA